MSTDQARKQRRDAPEGAPGRGVRSPVQMRRWLILVALLVVIAILVTPTVTSYLRQQSEIEATRQDIERTKQDVQDLQEQLRTWSDDAYVERQARERLRFVKEGETTFTVIDDTGSEYTETLPGMAPVNEEEAREKPWYGQVWSSVRIANDGLPEETP